jgi:hypothetical protein
VEPVEGGGGAEEVALEAEHRAGVFFCAGETIKRRRERGHPLQRKS